MNLKELQIRSKILKYIKDSAQQSIVNSTESALFKLLAESTDITSREFVRKSTWMLTEFRNSVYGFINSKLTEYDNVIFIKNQQ